MQINFDTTTAAAKYILVFRITSPVVQGEMFALKVACEPFIVQDVAPIDLY